MRNVRRAAELREERNKQLPRYVTRARDVTGPVTRVPCAPGHVSCHALASSPLPPFHAMPPHRLHPFLRDRQPSLFMPFIFLSFFSSVVDHGLRASSSLNLSLAYIQTENDRNLNAHRRAGTRENDDLSRIFQRRVYTCAVAMRTANRSQKRDRPNIAYFDERIEFLIIPHRNGDTAFYEFQCELAFTIKKPFLVSFFRYEIMFLFESLLI